MKGRSIADCVPIIGDQQWTEVTWKEKGGPGFDEGTPVTLRIEMKQAKVFGIEFD